MELKSEWWSILVLSHVYSVARSELISRHANRTFNGQEMLQKLAWSV